MCAVHALSAEEKRAGSEVCSCLWLRLLLGRGMSPVVRPLPLDLRPSQSPTELQAPCCHCPQHRPLALLLSADPHPSLLRGRRPSDCALVLLKTSLQLHFRRSRSPVPASLTPARGRTVSSGEHSQGLSLCGVTCWADGSKPLWK